jgi:hypothetical protein
VEVVVAESGAEQVAQRLAAGRLEVILVDTSLNLDDESIAGVAV